MDSIERLSFELSTRALAEQERMLAGMRTTAGTLVAAAAVAASLRSPSIARVSLGGAVPLAACTFSVACAIWVLMPHQLAFAVRSADLRLIDSRRGSRGLPGAHLIASLWTECLVHANKRVLGRVALALSLGCLFLLVEVVSLIVAIAW